MGQHDLGNLMRFLSCIFATLLALSVVLPISAQAQAPNPLRPNLPSPVAGPAPFEQAAKDLLERDKQRPKAVKPKTRNDQQGTR